MQPKGEPRPNTLETVKAAKREPDLDVNAVLAVPHLVELHLKLDQQLCRLAPLQACLHVWVPIRRSVHLCDKQG